MAEVIKLSRQVSIERIMRAIAIYGPISRASLAKEVKLSKQTISEVMLTLEGRDWVQTKGKTEGHVGRAAVAYEINPNCAGVLVVDLGGTKVRVCVANLVGEIVDEDVQPTDPKGGFHVLKQIEAISNDLIARGPLQRNQIRLAVIGVPGVPDEATGFVHMAPNIKDLDKTDVKAGLQDLLKLKVIVDNDVNLAAKGEYWLSVNSETDDLDESMAFISIGTGIGSGIIVNGDLVRGANGMAGEIGYLPFASYKDGQLSAETLDLENLCGSLAMQRQYFEKTGVNVDAKQIFELALDGNLDAKAAIVQVASFLTLAISSICFVVNPSKIVLGGSIGTAPMLVEAIKTKLSELNWKTPSVEVSKAGYRAALAGGVAIGLEQTQYDLFAANYSEGTNAQKFVPFKRVDFDNFAVIGSKQ